MSAIKLKGSTSGELTLRAPAVAGTGEVILPVGGGEFVTQQNVDNAPGQRIIAYDQRTSNLTVGGVDTNVFSLMIDIPAGRILRISAHGQTDSQTGADRRIVDVDEDGVDFGRMQDFEAGRRASYSGVVFRESKSGAHIYNLKYAPISGTNHRLEAAPSAVAWFMIEDYGSITGTPLAGAV